MIYPAPKFIGGEEVVAYSPIDHRHRPTGNCRHTVAGVVQGPAAGLAICKAGPSSFYLFGCDEKWSVITDTWGQTVKEAMAQAESEYTGISRTWVNHGPVWVPMDEQTYNSVWELFEAQFRFRPSTKATDWPGIVEPAPSITFDLSATFDRCPTFSGLYAAPELSDLQMRMFNDSDAEPCLTATWRLASPNGYCGCVAGVVRVYEV